MTLLRYLLPLLFLTTCQQADPSLDELEAAYATDPKAETLTALQAAYTDALANSGLAASEREEISVKQNILFIQQEDYASLGKTLESGLQENPPAPAFYRLLDSLLANMTDTQQGRLKPKAALQYIAAVTNHAKQHPQAAQSPQLLYKGAEIARSVGAYQRALDLYAQIEQQYPEYERAATALFMRAFTYGENLNNEDEARKLYEAFLQKYPNDDFADDAQMLLQTLGKSDEEIFDTLTKGQD